MGKTNEPNKISGNQIKTGDINGDNNANMNTNKTPQHDKTTMQVADIFQDLDVFDKAKVLNLIAELSEKRGAYVMAKKLIDTHSKIAGVTKPNDKGKDIQKILAKLKPNTKLTLIRESNNSYDKNVIKIYASSKHIGYIKSDLAKKVAPLLDKGHKYKAVISEVTGGTSGKSFGCNYQITIFDKGILEKLFK